MRYLKSALLLAIPFLFTTTAYAQKKAPARAVRAEQSLALVVDDINEEMRGYERDLKYFRRVPEFASLLQLRNQLVNQTAELSRLDKVGRGSGPAILKLAREMDRTVHQLDLGTDELEKRASSIANKDGITVARRMRAHADTMVRSTDEMVELFR